MHDRRAPAAKMFAGQRIFRHVTMLRQNRVDCAAEIADAFAVDDSHAQDAAFPTFIEIIEDKLFDLARLKCVQVQHAVNRKLDWFVHALI